MQENTTSDTMRAMQFSVAPMMKWTDRHCRAFHRALSGKARLYSEMLTAAAVIHGDRQRLLGFDPREHPVCLQIAGADPSQLAEAARIGAQWGYDEINLNCGCPSDRVQSGLFGACLMARPKQVAACVAAMADAVSIPVSVKCRIGLDDNPPCLDTFVTTVADSGCFIFIIHARSAWLAGINPKQNREKPPLRHDLVLALKRARPDLTIILNGGIASLDEVRDVLPRVDGVMLGRACYKRPAMLGEVDRALFGRSARVDPMQAALRHRAYIAAQMDRGVPLHAMTRHMLGLFSGRPGARAWRQTLAGDIRTCRSLDVYDRALEAVGEACLHAA